MTNSGPSCRCFIGTVPITGMMGITDGLAATPCENGSTGN